MNTYIIRVQLSGSPTWQTYAALHVAMENIGCIRRICGDDGRWHDLPHGNYQLISPATNTDVRNRVQALAERLNDDPDVLVTTALANAWKLPMSTGQRAAA